jgi:cytochrome c-type biogenesis protein CcmH/NrfG
VGWRPRAAGIVFEIVHPVADAGDDRSAGPMMRLVLEFWPQNFQALYHAGMSEYAVDDYERARAHLDRFLALYRTDDGWTRNAREVLGRPGMR